MQSRIERKGPVLIAMPKAKFASDMKVAEEFEVVACNMQTAGDLVVGQICDVREASASKALISLLELDGEQYGF